MGWYLSQPVMWSWDSGKQIPCFDVHCQVKHWLQAPTLAKSLTFHIGCPVVRIDYQIFLGIGLGSRTLCAQVELRFHCWLI